MEKIIKLLIEKIEKIKKNQNRAIIFWEDLKGENIEFLEEINITGLNVVVHNHKNQFKLKKLIELDKPKEDFLIYRIEEMKDNENWLLDIEKYSDSFSPDTIALLIDELDVKDELKDSFRNYEKFFLNQKRKASFEKFYYRDISEKEMFLSILAVLFKLNSRSFNDIMKAIIILVVTEEDKFYAELQKYNLKERFISLIRSEFGIDLEKYNSEVFIRKLILAQFAYKLNNKYFLDLEELNKNNCYITMDYLLKDKEVKSAISKYLEDIEDSHEIKNILENLTMEELLHIGTFEITDKIIIRKILEMTEEINPNYDLLINYIKIRKREITNYEKYISYYRVLETALEFLGITKDLKMQFIHAKRVIEAYVDKFYKIDTLYRKFYVSFEKISDNEQYMTLRDKIEIQYNNNYNRILSEEWESHLDEEFSMNHKILGVLNQWDFYNSEIAEYPRKKNKIFVIISDALRYEAGIELAELLAQESPEKSKIEKDYMFASVPSITSVCMSALLPNEGIRYDKGNITIKGISTKGSLNREKILKEKISDSIIISSSDIMRLSREEMIEITKGKYVVYIYHDTIDAIGDNKKTEDKVFDAVETAVEELKNLVLSLNSKAKANNIYITADHGFLYQRTELKEYDKLNKFQMDILEQGKRYIISEEDVQEEGLKKIEMKPLFKQENLKAYIPLRNFRIKQQGGGSKFVHGGISIQELLVPLIKFKSLKNEIEKKSKVELELLNSSRIISNNFINLSFLQTEKVDTLNKVFRRKVIIGLYDGDEPISDEKIVVLDSTGTTIRERQFDIVLNIKNKKYELYRKYTLKITDLEDDEVINSIDFDIRFNNF
ncbi:MAG: BREX-1 system phosphatase PglZ type A [Cetobacterium sp.]